MAALFPSLAHPVLREWQNPNLSYSSSLIYPLFITTKSPDHIEPIHALPGQNRYGYNKVCDAVEDLILNQGLKAVLLFGVLDSEAESKKDVVGSLADSGESQPVINAVKQLKAKFPQLLVMCDVCLCGYTSHGHCGVFHENSSRLDHRKSAIRMGEVAVAYAKAGADVVAPSDMMEGRVAEIKKSLRRESLEHVGVMSYIKSASSFYGPFRDAVDSGPRFGDRKEYQLPVESGELYMRAGVRDVREGSDFLIVKPATCYGDCIERLQQHPETRLIPTAAYQVSGEYAMFYHASKEAFQARGEQGGAFALDHVLLEAYQSYRRAGARLVITYFAPNLLKLFKKHPNMN